MLLDPVRRLLRLRTYLLMALALVTVVVAVLGPDVWDPLARLCPAPPTFGADVAPSVRAPLEALFDHDLLYCADAPEGIATLAGPVYWGSDGLNSILYFDATSMQGVGVARYGYNDFVPAPPGDAPPRGFNPVRAGREAYTNQAPVAGEERPGYYFRVQAAPLDSDTAVIVDVAGPATPQEGMTGRNFWLDLERLVGFLRNAATRAEGSRDAEARVAIPIVPRRWEAVRRRQVTPELAGEDGQPSLDVITKAQLEGPTLYQTASGLLSGAVWVAGVVTDTTPALVLVPDGGGAPIAPVSSALWTTAISPMTLASFGFEPRPPGAIFEARFWQDAGRQASAPPDETWRLAFP